MFYLNAIVKNPASEVAYWTAKNLLLRPGARTLTQMTQTPDPALADLRSLEVAWEVSREPMRDDQADDSIRVAESGFRVLPLGRMEAPYIPPQSIENPLELPAYNPEGSDFEGSLLGDLVWQEWSDDEGNDLTGADTLNFARSASWAAARNIEWMERNHDGFLPDEYRDLLPEEKALAMLAVLNGMRQPGDLFAYARAKTAVLDWLQLQMEIEYQGLFVEQDVVVSSNPHFGTEARRAPAQTTNILDLPGVDFDFAVEKLREGASVEVVLAYAEGETPDALRLTGRQAFPVVGAYEVGNVMRLHVLDDLQPGAPGGGVERVLTLREQNGLLYVHDLDANRRRERARIALVAAFMAEGLRARDFERRGPLKELEPARMRFEEPAEFSDNNWTVELNFAYELEPTQELAFANFYLRDLATGKEAWVGQNLPLSYFPNRRELSYWVDLSRYGFDPEGPLDFGYDVSDTLVIEQADFNPGAWERLPLDTTEYNVGWDDLSPQSHTPPVVFFEPETEILPDFVPGALPRITDRGCNIPNIDLDATRHNPETTPGYAGDNNACSPAAAANSLQWLEAEHPEISSGLTLREKLEELSELADRQENRGTLDSSLVKAKLAFAEKHRLPIRVKFQHLFLGDSAYVSPEFGKLARNESAPSEQDSLEGELSWDWLMNEMEEGEDVELIYTWRRRELGRTLSGRHALVVTGVSEIGGRRFIHLKDDGNQQRAGGLRERIFTLDSTREGRFYFREFMRDGQFTGNNVLTTHYIAGLVSESYDSTVTYVSRPEARAGEAFSARVQPNPFSGQTTFALRLAKPADLTLELRDVTGRLVATERFTANAGETEHKFDAADLSAGAYFYTLRAKDGRIAEGKLIVK